MLTCRFLVLSIFSTLLLLSAVSASAQSDPGQWVGDLYLVDANSDGIFTKRDSSLLIDEENYIHKTIPSLFQAVDFQIPRRYLVCSGGALWYNDALYEIAYGNNEKSESIPLFRRWTFAKWEDDKWHYIGDYKTTDTHNLLRAIPCDNDKYIVISAFTDLTGNAGPDRTPFAIMSIPSGGKDLRVVSSIAHGQEDHKDNISGKGFAVAIVSDIIIAGKYAVVLNPTTGLYWIFSLEKATLLKAGNIFKKVTPEMVAKDGFPYAILCANPEKEGTILIAAQEEDFFIAETGNAGREKLELVESNPSIDFEVLNQIYDRRVKEIADRSPFIVWYRLYPENGKVERLSLPPEGGSHLRNGGKNDIWRPMPDGSVKMGVPRYSEKKPEKPKQEGGKEITK